MEDTYNDKLDYLKKLIDIEHGDSSVPDSTLITKCNLDSFGVYVVLVDMDEKYGVLSKVPDNIDPISVIDFSSLTLKDIATGNVVNDSLLNKAILYNKGD